MKIRLSHIVIGIITLILLYFVFEPQINTIEKVQEVKRPLQEIINDFKDR